MKKQLAFIVSVVLVLTTILAIQGNRSMAEVIVDTTKKGSITIHKYEVEDLNDYQTEGTGETGDTQQITGTNGVKPDDDNINETKPLKGITFEIYKEPNEGVFDEDLLNLTTEEEIMKKLLTIYNTTSDELKNHKAGSGVTDENGEYTFSNLDLGRYLVVETDHSGPIEENAENVVHAVKPFLVDIPLTNKDGTSLIYDVNVYPKNQTVYGAAILTKIDMDNSHKFLQGAQYSLYQYQDSNPDNDQYDRGEPATLRLSGLTTNENGQIIVEGLPFGDYYFVETKAPDGYLIDNQTKYTFTVNATGAVTLGDNQSVLSKQGEVHELTIMNNEELTVDKDVVEQGNDTTTQDVDKRVKWIITSEIPRNIYEYKTYTITDVLPKELTYADGSIKAYMQNATTKQKIEGGDLVKSDTLGGNGTGEYCFQLNGQTLQIDLIPTATRFSADNDNDGIKDFMETYEQGPTLVVEFETVLNHQFLTNTDNQNFGSLGQQIKNNAQLHYEINTDLKEDPTEPNDHDTDVPDEKQPEVHTGGYTILKVDKNEKKLAGAEFKIIDSKEKPTSTTDVTYKQAFNESNEYVDTFISNSNGEVIIKGLAYGDYWIVETKAPEGYKLYEKVMEIHIDEQSHNYNAEKNLKVVNRSDVILPITGGKGPIIITVLGILVIAIGIMVFKRDKQNRK